MSGRQRRRRPPPGQDAGSRAGPLLNGGPGSAAGTSAAGYRPGTGSSWPLAAAAPYPPPAGPHRPPPGRPFSRHCRGRGAGARTFPAGWRLLLLLALGGGVAADRAETCFLSQFMTAMSTGLAVYLHSVSRCQLSVHDRHDQVLGAVRQFQEAADRCNDLTDAHEQLAEPGPLGRPARQLAADPVRRRPAHPRPHRRTSRVVPISSWLSRSSICSASWADPATWLSWVTGPMLPIAIFPLNEPPLMRMLEPLWS